MRNDGGVLRDGRETVASIVAAISLGLPYSWLPQRAKKVMR